MIKRTQYGSFRLTEQENQKIRERAASLHLSFSEFIRRRALEKQIVPEADLQKLREIRRLGKLLKQTFLETQGGYSQDLADAISAIGNYAREQAENLNRQKNQNGTRIKEGLDIDRPR